MKKFLPMNLLDTKQNNKIINFVQEWEENEALTNGSG